MSKSVAFMTSREKRAFDSMSSAMARVEVAASSSTIWNLMTSFRTFSGEVVEEVVDHISTSTKEEVDTISTSNSSSQR